MRTFISNLKQMWNDQCVLDPNIRSYSLSDSDLPRIEEMRYRCNLCRLAVLSIFVIVVQISNVIVMLVTALHKGHRLEAAAAGFVFVCLCYVYILIVDRYWNKPPDIKHAAQIVRSFFLFYIAVTFFFCWLEYITSGGMLNYELLLMAIIIIPILSPRESLFYIGLSLVAELFVLYASGHYPLNRIQLCILTAGAGIVISNMLYRSYVAAGIAQLKLERIADTDVLTGLLNRRGLDQKLKQIWSSATKNQTRLMAAMIDVDFFKAYNDRFGHYAGDKCLSEIAKCIAANCRQREDALSRFGGEEFIIIAKNISDENIALFLTRLLSKIENLNIEAGQPLVSDYVTVSIGAVSFDVQNDLDFEALYRLADEQLLKAKANGRNALSLNGILYRETRTSRI